MFAAHIFMILKCIRELLKIFVAFQKNKLRHSSFCRSFCTQGLQPFLIYPDVNAFVSPVHMQTFILDVQHFISK